MCMKNNKVYVLGRSLCIQCSKSCVLNGGREGERERDSICMNYPWSNQMLNAKASCQNVGWISSEILSAFATQWCFSHSRARLFHMLGWDRHVFLTCLSLQFITALILPKMYSRYFALDNSTQARLLSLAKGDICSPTTNEITICSASWPWNESTLCTVTPSTSLSMSILLIRSLWAS